MNICKRFIILLILLCIPYNYGYAGRCDFDVSADSKGSYPLDEIDNWIFWTNVDQYFYHVDLTIPSSALPLSYAIIFVHPDGTIENIKTNQPRPEETIATNDFPFVCKTCSGGGYQIQVIRQYVPDDIVCTTQKFYFGAYPNLNLTVSPSPLIIGQEAIVSWTVSGGVSGFPDGGWKGTLRLKWYQNNNELGVLATIPVSDHQYKFNVPETIGNASVPGHNFQIFGENTDSGSIVVPGVINDRTSYFEIKEAQIKNPDLAIIEANISPAIAKQGQECEFNFFIQNIGSKKSYGTVLEVFVDNEEIFDKIVIALNPGESLRIDEKFTFHKSGRFEIICTVGKIYGDMNVSNNTKNLSLQVKPPPSISISPNQGHQGTQFQLSGQGFTPSSTVMVVLQDLYGNLLFIDEGTQTDTFGEFNYRWICNDCNKFQTLYFEVTDVQSGTPSNKVAFSVRDIFQNIELDVSNITNIGKVSNEFQVFLSVDDQYNFDICDAFYFKIYDNDGNSATQVHDDGCTFLKSENNQKNYRLWFRINPTTKRAAYFKNAHFDICYNEKICKHIEGLDNFSVYGSTFDISKHAWKFANTSWDIEINHNKKFKVYKFADELIEEYVEEGYRSKVWTFIGDTSSPSRGLCYGLVHAAIANYTHQDDTTSWGQDKDNKELGINELINTIDQRWDKTNYRAKSPYKPFIENNIYTSEKLNDPIKIWTFQSATKIIYYFLSQDLVKGSNWVGNDHDKRLDIEIDKESIAQILKNGSPVSFGIDPPGHRMAITQQISWMGVDKYIIWDNNLPYLQDKINDAPYLEWIPDDNKNDTMYFIKTDGSTDDIKYSEISYIAYLTRESQNLTQNSGDSQNIYNLWPQNQKRHSILANESRDTKVNHIDYQYIDHIEILIVGASINQVLDNSNEQKIQLIPHGEINEGKSVINTSANGIFQCIYLPAQKTYRITATKLSDFFTTIIFVSIPNDDGTVEKFNYENLETDENDATQFDFIVGRNNLDTSIKRRVSDHDENDYSPDFHKEIPIQIDPPTNFHSRFNNGQIHLQWENDSHSGLSSILILRKESDFPDSPDDGDSIFNGLSNSVTDTSINTNTTYYYAAFSIDYSGNYSKPVFSVIDTQLFFVYGQIHLSNGSGLNDCQLLLKDHNGKSIQACSTDAGGMYQFSNLQQGEYIIEASHQDHNIDPDIKTIQVHNQNEIHDFLATPVPSVFFLLNHFDARIGNIVPIQWTFRHIENNQLLNIDLFRTGATEQIARNVPILSGNFHWTVMGNDDPNAKLQLSLVSDPDIRVEQKFNIHPNSPPNVGVVKYSTQWEWQTPLPENTPINDIWGESENNIFAVSENGKIYHFDGQAWTEMNSNTRMSLYSIWGFDHHNVFAVGWNGTILHYDGQQWRTMNSESSSTLEGVWGITEKNVFAVGSSGTILHYDGTTWSQMPCNARFYLLDVFGITENDVFAVGWHRNSGIIVHYDGSAWEEMETIDDNLLNGIWGTSANDMFAVGENGTILHFDGTEWSEMPCDHAETFYEIWGSSSNDVFAVGEYGTIMHYDGGSWSKMNSETSSKLSGVWGLSNKNVYVVGFHETIIHISTIMNEIPDIFTNENTTAKINFIADDLEYPKVYITVRSSNPGLIPNSDIQILGETSFRTMTLTPAPNRHGIANISIHVSDVDGLMQQVAFDVKVGEYDAVFDGDIDHNDTVNLMDAILVLKIISGLNPGDVYSSQKMGLAEVIFILQSVTKLY